MNCIPAKVKAIHICTGSGKSVTELVLPVLKQMAGLQLRLRFNLHVSNHALVLSTIIFFFQAYFCHFLFEHNQGGL